MEGSVPLEKVVDSSDLPPGINAPFDIGDSAAMCGDSVYYQGATPLAIGIYSISGGEIEVVANESVLFPGTINTFERALYQSCSEDHVVFVGSDDAGPMSLGASVFSYRDGTIAPILERGTPIGGAALIGLNFLDSNQDSFVVDSRLEPTVSNQAIVVMPFDGVPTIVADRTMVMPGQVDPVTIFGEPILAETDVVFRARTGQNMGIYRWGEGLGLSLIADTATPVPISGQGVFNAFGLTAHLTGGVVFGADYAGGLGLFQSQNGGLAPLVIPGATTANGSTLVAARRPKGAGQLLSFTGWTIDLPFRDVIFVRTPEGELVRLVGVEDTIDGKQVLDVASFTDDRDVLVWLQLLEPGSPTSETALYRARFGSSIDIPTLSWRGAFVVGLILTLLACRALRQSIGT